MNTFRKPDGAPIAQTGDQRYALANILAQNPKLTPQQFAFAQDMAMLSNSVYPKVKGDPSQGLRETVPPHYERVTDFSRDPRLKGLTKENFSDPDTGFYADLFLNKSNKDQMTYVVSFRGTQSGRNWVSNINQSLGRPDPQYQKAMRLAGELRDRLGDDLTAFTGHSQGGGQAAAAAMIAKRPAIAFDSAGLHRNTVAREGGTWNESFITNYNVEGEILTYSQNHEVGSQILPRVAGEQISIKPFDGEGLLLPPGLVSSRELHRSYHLLRGMLADPQAMPPVK